MRSAPAIALLVTALAVEGCDAYGGSTDESGGGGSTTFVVASRYPGPGSSGVSVATYVEVGFNGIIDTTSVKATSITLEGAPFGTVSANGNKLRFTPGGPLEPGSRYTIGVSSDLRGTNGHLLGSNPTWGFKTAGPFIPPDTNPPLGPRPR